MAWFSLLLPVLTVLAVCRITRLVTEDTITQPVRDWVTGRMAARPDGRPAARAWRYLAKLLTCPWCSGFWISAAAVLALFRMWFGLWPTTAPTVFAYTAAVFATSQLTGLFHDWLDSPPPVRVHSLAPLDVTVHRDPS